MRNTLKILKGLFYVAVFLLLFLTWWSSSLLEEKVRLLQNQLTQVKEQHSPPLLEQKPQKKLTKTPFQETSALSLADNRLPNLLKNDPFFEKTLPRLIENKSAFKGIRREALFGRPENLHPFNAFKDISQLVSMCSGSVANLQFGRYETMTPELAIKMEARPQKENPHLIEYWIHLRDDLYWEPLDPAFFPPGFELAPWFQKRHPVTAYDFKFYYDAVMNPYISEPKAVALRSYYAEIESFEVINPLTFVIKWQAFKPPSGEEKVKYSSLSLTGSLMPLASFVYQYFSDGEKIVEDDSALDTYRNDSIWAQNFSHHWAKNVIPSCGPYLFAGMTDEGITLKRNPNYYQSNAVLVEGVQYKFKESSDAIWQEFKAGALDLCLLSPNQELEFEQFLKSPMYQKQKEQGNQIHTLEYVDRCFFYIGWNCNSPFFKNAQVRKAMTLAIDRSRIIEQNLAGHAVAITGPLFCQSQEYNKSLYPWPYDPSLASRILDEEGWLDYDGDGIREKKFDGKNVRFSFKLCYLVKSLTSKIIAQYVATALQNVGVQCEPYGMDIADLSRQFDEKGFDALCMGWKLGTPPSDPRQIWHSDGAKIKGSSNAIGFVNHEVDQIIEQLNYEDDQTKRAALYHRFHKILHEECPYTFLYTPKARLVYRDRLRNLFIPSERQDLIPGADIPEPSYHVTWLKN